MCAVYLMWAGLSSRIAEEVDPESNTTVNSLVCKHFKENMSESDFRSFIAGIKAQNFVEPTSKLGMSSLQRESRTGRNSSFLKTTSKSNILYHWENSKFNFVQFADDILHCITSPLLDDDAKIKILDRLVSELFNADKYRIHHLFRQIAHGLWVLERVTQKNLLVAKLFFEAKSFQRELYGAYIGQGCDGYAALVAACQTPVDDKKLKEKISILLGWEIFLSERRLTIQHVLSIMYEVPFNEVEGIHFYGPRRLLEFQTRVNCAMKRLETGV